MSEKEILGKVFCDVLQKQTYLMGEVLPHGDFPLFYSYYLKAEMSFYGDLSGKLFLIIPEKMCAELTASILGVENADILFH